jgi:hypothetical protein
MFVAGENLSQQNFFIEIKHTVEFDSNKKSILRILKKWASDTRGSMMEGNF